MRLNEKIQKMSYDLPGIKSHERMRLYLHTKSVGIWITINPGGTYNKSGFPPFLIQHTPSIYSQKDFGGSLEHPDIYTISSSFTHIVLFFLMKKPPSNWKAVHRIIQLSPFLLLLLLRCGSHIPHMLPLKALQP